MDPLRTFKLTIAYDGSDFAGWQVQPGKLTIQGMLQQAMQRIGRERVHVIGSGRTDSGVHALGQVASCTLHWRDSADRLALALNANLPETIVVEQAAEAAADFHAIRDAVGKRYRYQLQLGGRRDAFEYRYRWRLPYELDLEAMRDAARLFLGRHDFHSFQAAGSDRKTTTRTILACEVLQQATSHRDRQHVAIEIEADGFLYNMVRNMVGTLVEVGRGRKPSVWIDELFAARNRDLAGQTAPAHGLFLLYVDYPSRLFGQRHFE